MGISKGRAAAMCMWISGLCIGIGAAAENGAELLYGGALMSIIAIIFVRNSISP